MMRRTVERVRMRWGLANSDLNTTDRDKVGLACIRAPITSLSHALKHTITSLSHGAGGTAVECGGPGGPGFESCWCRFASELLTIPFTPLCLASFG